MAPDLQDYHEHVHQLISAALAAVDPAIAVKKILQKGQHRLRIGATTRDLAEGDIYLIAVGKAAIPMGMTAAEILGESLVEGVLITKDEGSESVPVLSYPTVINNLFVYPASHPVTDERGIHATARAIQLARRAKAGDVVICLISGGASSLFSHPLIPLSGWQQLTNQLLASGCTINELNTVRKQLDEVKGGGLLSLAAPATCISLILSDVVGNPLDVIGSGPTIPNPDDPATALSVMRRYNMKDKLAPELWIKVLAKLEGNESFELGDCPPPCNYIIGDVHLAAEAARKAATDLGFHSTLLTSHLEGEAREVGRVVAALAKDMQPGSCLILGGETTVTLKGDGLGGRNQELALSAALAIDGLENLVLASFATDGDDGPTDAAGAIVTGLTIAHAKSQGLDPVVYLDSNDSYSFFNLIGGLIITGQTGTNVNDLIFLLKYQ